MRRRSNLSTDEDAFDLPRLCRYFSELSPQPMLAVEGPDYVVRHINGAFAHLSGREADDLIGRPFAEAVPEEAANGCLALLNRVYRTGTAEALVEQEHRQSPRAFWSYLMWAIRDADGRPVGVMIQVTDATEAALFREQVTAMNQSLLLSSLKQHEITETVEELNAALKEQSAALTDEDRRKDEFLAMLAHELRNPLAALMNAVYILGLEKNESGVQQGLQPIIERQATQLARLVNDMLEVSRITNGRIQIRPEPVVANGIMEQAAATSRPTIEQHRHTLSLSLPACPIWLLADSARLEQIIVNLLANAAKYTPDGGHIWLSIAEEGAEAVIRVRDTGVGIPPELLPRIFSLFTQGERTLDRSQGGLGIGLALVQRLVELHRGTVDVVSAVGQGSEFVVRLPIAPSDVPAPIATSCQVVRPAAPSLRVLVVDDDVDTARTMAMLLNAAGHQTRLAHDGPGTLQGVIDYQPDLVLLDIGLPGMDGYEVARRIREQSAGEPIALIAVTGYAQPADDARSQAAVFNQYLVKPVAPEKLSEALAVVKRRPR